MSFTNVHTDTKRNKNDAACSDNSLHRQGNLKITTNAMYFGEQFFLQLNLYRFCSCRFWRSPSHNVVEFSRLHKWCFTPFTCTLLSWFGFSNGKQLQINSWSQCAWEGSQVIVTKENYAERTENERLDESTNCVTFSKCQLPVCGGGHGCPIDEGRGAFCWVAVGQGHKNRGGGCCWNQGSLFSPQKVQRTNLFPSGPQMEQVRIWISNL